MVSNRYRYFAICLRCWGSKVVTVQADTKILVSCPWCCGTGRDPIPWAELFKGRRHFPQ